MDLIVTRTISEKEWSRFSELLTKANFWNMAAEEGELTGIDGAVFLLEGKKQGHYHVVGRWFPEDRNFTSACGYLLEISGWKQKTNL